MATIVTNTNRVHDGCNYYLMCRISNDEWVSFLNKAFVLHSNNGKLHGQFLSSSWFKKQIQCNDTLDVLVVRLPRRDSTFHPDIMITADMLSQRLTEYETNNLCCERLNYEDLDFVAIHKHYRCDTIKYTCNMISERKSGNNINNVTDESIFGTHNGSNINMTFEMLNEIDSFVNLNILDNSDSDTLNESLDIPRLCRNDGSWNIYRNSFSDTNNDHVYYITCPQFTLNI
jgi:hypothetical protein